MYQENVIKFNKTKRLVFELRVCHTFTSFSVSSFRENILLINQEYDSTYTIIKVTKIKKVRQNSRKAKVKKKK